MPEGTGEDCRMAVSEQLQPAITVAIIITAMTSQKRSAVRTIYRQMCIIYVNNIYDDLVIEKICGMKKKCEINNLPRYGCTSAIYINK